MVNMHKQWQEKVAVYHSLTTAEQVEVKQHLQSCPECAFRLAAYQQMDHDLAALPMPNPPAELRPAFYAKLDVAVRRQHSFHWLRRWQQIGRLAGQGAVLMLLIVLVGSMWLSVRQRPFHTTAFSVSKPTLTPTIAPSPTSTPIPIPTVTPRPKWTVVQQPTIQSTRVAIESMAAAADGNRLVLGLGSRRVQLWQTERGELSRYWIMPNLAARSVALSPDGRWLAAGSADYQGYVMRWSVTGADEEVRLDEPSDTVTALVFSPDSRLLAAGTDQRDGQVYLWQMAGNRLQHRFKAEAGISILAFSPDGRYLAAGTTSGTIQIWQVAAAELLNTVTISDQAVTSLSFSSDGQTVAAGAADGLVQMYTMSTTELLPVFAGEAAMQDVVLNVDATLLAAIFADGEVRLWQIIDGKPSQLYRTQIELPANFQSKLLFAEDHLQLITAYTNGSIQIWYFQPE